MLRGHVADYRFAIRIGNMLPLGAVDAVIGAVVKIARLIAQTQLRWNIAVPSVGAVAGDVNFSVLFGFLCRETGEVARHGIVRAFIFVH